MVHGTSADNTVRNSSAGGVNEAERADAPERPANFRSAANNRHGTTAENTAPIHSEEDHPTVIDEPGSSSEQVRTLPHRRRPNVTPFRSEEAASSSSTAPVAPPPMPSDNEITVAVNTAVQDVAQDAQQSLAAIGVTDAPMPQPGETTQSFGKRVDAYITKLKTDFPHVNNAYQIILRNMTTVPLQVMAREGLVNLSLGDSSNWSNPTRMGLATTATVSTMALTGLVMLHDRLKHRDTPITAGSNIAALAGLAAVTGKALSEGVIGNVVEALGKAYYITILRDITAVFHTISANTNSPQGMVRCLSQLGMLFLVYMGMQAAMSAIQGFPASHSGTNTSFDPESHGQKAIAYAAYALTVTLPEIAFDLVDGYSDAALYGAGNEGSRQTGLQGMRNYRVDAKWVASNPERSVGQRLLGRGEGEMTARLQALHTLYTLDSIITEDGKRRGATARATAGSALGWESLFLGFAGALFFKGRIDYRVPQARTDEERAGGDTRRQNTAPAPQLPPATNTPQFQITAAPANAEDEQVQAEALRLLQTRNENTPNVQPPVPEGTQVQDFGSSRGDVRTLYHLGIDATVAREAATALNPAIQEDVLEEVGMTMLRFEPPEPGTVRTLSSTSGSQSRGVSPDVPDPRDRPEPSNKFQEFRPGGAS